MRRHAVLIGAVLAMIACGGSDSASTTEPGGNGGTGGTGGTGATATNGTFSAQIGTVNWSAQGTVTVSRSGNAIALAATGLVGTTNAYTVVLSIGSATGPGTYSLTYLNPAASNLIVGSAVGGWGTYFSGGTGTATITTLASNRIAGTFTADAVPGTTGATGTLQVRNGRFDVTF